MQEKSAGVPSLGGSEKKIIVLVAVQGWAQGCRGV